MQVWSRVSDQSDHLYPFLRHWLITTSLLPVMTAIMSLLFHIISFIITSLLSVATPVIISLCYYIITITSSRYYIIAPTTSFIRSVRPVWIELCRTPRIISSWVVNPNAWACCKPQTNSKLAKFSNCVLLCRPWEVVSKCEVPQFYRGGPWVDHQESSLRKCFISLTPHLAYSNDHESGCRRFMINKDICLGSYIEIELLLLV